MTGWLESGVRRDVCAILYDEGELPSQALKTRIEAHYDERLDPRQFYGRLDALQKRGYVEKRTEGLSDVYTLTEAGEGAVEDHFEWLRERVEK